MDRLTKERLKVYYLGTRPWTRHSLVLLVAGLAYLGIGYAYYTEVGQTPERQLGLQFILQSISFSTWGLIFMLVGGFTVISSRWPPISEKWGYTLLTGLSAVWAAGYFFSLIFYDSPASNATGTIVWSLVAFLWWAISGLVNPPQVVKVVDDGSG